MTLKTRPAQIVYREDAAFRVMHPKGGRYVGRLLNPRAARDKQCHLKPVLRGKLAPIYEITSRHGDIWYVKMRGRGNGGTRHRWFQSLDEAQTHGIKWAARRFRIPVEA